MKCFGLGVGKRLLTKRAAGRTADSPGLSLVEFRNCLSTALSYRFDFFFLCGPEWSQELDAMILGGPTQGVAGF